MKTPSSPDESAILEAIESTDSGQFEAFLRTVGDTDFASRVRGMRADRGAVRAFTVEDAPVGLLGSAMDEAFGELDESVVARLLPGLSDGPDSCDGPPVSRIEPYHESLSLRVWRRRREAGMLAAAVLVFAVGIGIVSGVRAIQSANPLGPVVIQPSLSDEPVLARSDGESAAAPGIAPDESFSIASPSPAIAPDLERVASVFEASPLLGSGRLVVYARAGSAARASAAMRTMADQEIGSDHSFTVVAAGGGLTEDSVASIGLPPLDAPVVASEEGPPVAVLMPERASWTAVVERDPAALAALRKRLEEAGMTVEFLLINDPIEVRAEPRANDLLWWSSPASTWRRTAAVPVVIDSLPD